MTKKSIAKMSLIKRASHKNRAIKDDDNGWLTYSNLIKKVADRLLALDKLERSLFFVYPSNNIDSVVEIIALLESCHVLCLLDPNTTITNKKNLYKTYQPNYEFINGKLSKVSNKMISMHPELKLLLTTSGSTGNPKLVKLTMKNILHNAKAISTSLSIGVSDIACGHLALQYAFGLSVITSHLFSGASVRLTDYSFSDSEFWKLVRADEITHLPECHFIFKLCLGLDLSA